jgi:hypothetical protein
MTRTDATEAPTAPFTDGPEHQRLRSLVGTWDGLVRTWFEPDKPPDETRLAARIDALLGGRFVRIDYQGTAMGKPHAGQMLLAYERDERRYAMAWLDSFHTGTALMLSTGQADADGAVSVLGSYAAGDERWGWRTVFRFGDRPVIQAFNIPPGMDEVPAIEIRLTRR